MDWISCVEKEKHLFLTAANKGHQNWAGELKSHWFLAEKVEQQVWAELGTLTWLTEEDDDTEQYGHQGSSGEAIWEGQDLRAAGLHVAAAVAGTDAHDERAGAALDGVVVVWDHHGQEIHAHLSPAEASSPCQDIGSVVCGVSQQRNRLQRQLERPVFLFLQNQPKD